MVARLMVFLFCLATSISLSVGYGSEERLRIGYVSSGLGDEFQVRLLDAARKAVGDDAVLTVADAANDAALQRRQVKRMLDAGAEALIVVAVNAAEVDALTLMARERRVPLVFLNRNPFEDRRPPDGCYFVGANSFAEGEALARLAGTLVGPRGNVFVLQGRLPSGPAESRTEGIRHALSITYPEMAIVAEAPADWQRDTAREVTERWIAAYGAASFDGVLAQNDLMALGALDALEKAGRTDVVVVGVDALPAAVDAILEGRMAGSILQDPDIQGRRAVETAIRAANGGAGALSVIVPFQTVIRDNAASVLPNGVRHDG